MTDASVSQWDELFAVALPALDHVFGANSDENQPARWTLGGGTAIALRLDHRISHDVDLFVPGVALKLFSPAFNPAAKAISPVFQWPGHDLKFERPEGEVDFLSSALQTSPGYSWTSFRDRRFALETAEEVVVKKIRYRSARFTGRDLYDLAVVADACPELPRVLAVEVPDALSRVRARIEMHIQAGIETFGQSIVETPSYRTFVPRAFGIARAALAAAQAIVDG